MLNLLFRPVSLIVAIFVVILSFSSFTSLGTDALCEHSFGKSITRNFYHVNLAHLGINLMAFNVLSRIEDIVGSGPYILLLFMLLLISSVLDFIANLMFPTLKCSIGFSGILFGLLSWEMMALHDFDPSALLLLVVNVIAPTLRDPKASLIGHSIGAIAGVIVAFFWDGIDAKPISPPKFTFPF